MSKSIIKMTNNDLSDGGNQHRKNVRRSLSKTKNPTSCQIEFAAHPQNKFLGVKRIEVWSFKEFSWLIYSLLRLG
jgi:hypothetical protein